MTKILFSALGLLALVLLFSACKSKKYALPSESTDAQITFGSGGGISGLVNDYTLLKNGQLFKRNSQDKKFVAIKSAKKDAVSQVYKNYEFLGLDKLEVNEPGNMYYFIEHKSEDGKINRLTWGNGESPHEENLKLYYSLLSNLIEK